MTISSQHVKRLQTVFHLAGSIALAFGLWKLFFNKDISIHITIFEITSSTPAPLQYLPLWLSLGAILGALSYRNIQSTHNNLIVAAGVNLVALIGILIVRHSAQSYVTLLPSIFLFALSLTYYVFHLVKNWESTITAITFKPFNLRPEVYLAIAIFLLYAVFSLVRHFGFGSNTADLGVYDQTAYLLSQGQAPILTTHYSDIHAFAVHFEPFLYLMAPFYWLYPSAIWLLLLQAAAVALGVVAIFKIAKHFNLPSHVPFFLSLAYGLSAGIQNGINFDFHSAMLMPAAILWLFYFALSKQYLKLIALALLFMLIKEDASMYVIFFGIYVAIRNRDWKWGALLSAIGLTWLIVAVKFIIPSFNNGNILNLIFDRIGKNIEEVLRTLFFRPLHALQVFFDPLHIKIPVIVITLLHGALLWIWAPWELLLLLPMFGIRFFSSRIDIWTYSMYYAAPTIAVVIASALVGSHHLRLNQPNIKFKLLRKITISSQKLTTILVIFAASFSVLFGVFGIASYHFSYPVSRTVFNPDFYARLWSDNSTEIRQSLNVIPDNGKVCASQSYLPHLTTRSYAAMFSNCNERYHYFAVNTKVNNWPFSQSELATKLNQKINHPNGKVIFSGENTLIVTTNPEDTSPAVEVTPSMKQWLDAH